MLHAAPSRETRTLCDAQQFNRESNHVTLRRSRAPVALLALIMGVPCHALAQATPRAAQLDAPSTPGASLAADDGTNAAREHITRGENLYDAQSFEGAIAEFQRAYELLEGHTARYQVLYNLALCQERLGHYSEALHHYQRYLDEGGPDAEDRAAVQASMRTLEGLLGTLVLHIRFERNAPPDEYEIWVDQRLVDHAGGKLLLPSGRHSVEVRAEHYESVLREVSMTARTERVLSVQLERRAQGLKPRLFWTGVGLTAAGAIATGVLGGRALALSHDVQDKPALARTDQDRSDVRKATLAADVTLGATGALALGTVIVLFLTDFEKPRDQRAPQAGLSWLPQADVGFAWSVVLR
jgi:tetratricopeptide (TPR) repeat protein